MKIHSHNFIIVHRIEDKFKEKEKDKAERLT